MTPEVFRRSYEELGFTQVKIADLLNVTERTIRSYATSDGPTVHASMLMYLLKRGIVTEEQLRLARNYVRNQK